MNESRIEREAKKRSRKKIRPIVIVFAVAILAVLLTVLYVYFSLGLRYLVFEDGTKFLGRCANNEPQSGTVYYTDGSTAEYDAASQKLVYKNGDVYTGGLQNFLRSGQGKLVSAPTGDTYDGAFLDNLANGQGKSLFANGDSYEGDFINGAREGQGAYTWASGATYVGSFKNNLKEGSGFYSGADGSSYDGQYSSDLKNGTGVYKWANGDSYDGAFVNDVRTGYGIYTWANGETYKGNFVNNKMDTRKIDESGNFLKNESGAFVHGDTAVYSWPTDNPNEPKLYTGYFEANAIVKIDESAAA